jgi:hypothetical protein
MNGNMSSIYGYMWGWDSVAWDPKCFLHFPELYVFQYSLVLYLLQILRNILPTKRLACAQEILSRTKTAIQWWTSTGKIKRVSASLINWFVHKKTIEVRYCCAGTGQQIQVYLRRDSWMLSLSAWYSFKHSASLSVTGITRCSAWVHLGNNKLQLRELSTSKST